MPVVTIPGVGRVHFPDEMSLDDIQSAAAELHDGVGRDPNTGAFNEDLAKFDRAMSGTAPAGSDETRPYRFTVPGMGGRGFEVGGPVSKAANWLNSVREEDSVPIALATAGSVAVPPGAAQAGASLLSRFAPTVLAASGGGAAGGGMVEATKPDSTAGAIARESLQSGLEMGAAEVGGLAIGGLANRLIAPRLTFLDPGKPMRESAAVAARKAKAQLGTIAEKVAKVVNRGVGDDPAGFLARVASDKRLVAKLEKVLSSKQLRAFMRFAKSDLGSEAFEAAAVPVATALGGPLAGAATWAAKSLIAPGPALRYLSRTGLPSTAVRTAGRQAATTALRAGAHRTGGGF